MPQKKTTRPGSGPAADDEPQAYIRWINGRAYGEFGAWAQWGGKRQERLIARRERFATDNKNTAAELFAGRLKELREKRAEHPDGTPETTNAIPTALASFIGYHLAMKRDVKGRKKASEQELKLQRTRLVHAGKFFHGKGIRDIRRVNQEVVEQYMEFLAGDCGTGKGARKRGRCAEVLNPGTQRKYLNALSQLLKRAVSKELIRTNFVERLVDRPTSESSPTEHLEIWEAAILLEAARRLFPMSHPGVPVYPVLAWELLTGCIETETKSREIQDLRMPGDAEFPHGVVMVRSNVSRDSLKTEFRTRFLSLQPQLAEIMAEYLSSAQAPKGRLLFSGGEPDQPVGDWRKPLDLIAAVAGFGPSEVRSIRFRPTFATHRAYTSDEHGQPMTAIKLSGEMGHGSFKMLEERYFKAARFRRSRPHLEYRWGDWADVYRERLARGIAGLLTATQVRALSALGQQRLTPGDWMRASELVAGTFYPVRVRLGQLELVERIGEGRGGVWALTQDGRAVLAALTASPQRLAA